MTPCNDSVRDRVADMLAENDACGPGPVSRGEYLADADAILRLVVEEMRAYAREWGAPIAAGADFIERAIVPDDPLPGEDRDATACPSTTTTGRTRRIAELERENTALREGLHTIAYWRGPLTAADAGTMCMTARAALDASSREQRQ